MNFQKEHEFVYQKVNEFIKKINRPELEGRIIVQFSYIKSNAVALCYCSADRKSARLVFDIVFWKSETEIQKVATIAHEFAHFLQKYLFPVRPQKPHGKEFKICMKLLGYEVKGADCYSQKHIAARKKL